MKFCGYSCGTGGAGRNVDEDVRRGSWRFPDSSQWSRSSRGCTSSNRMKIFILLGRTANISDIKSYHWHSGLGASIAAVPTNSSYKESRALFSVVKFPNDACTATNGLIGTCLTSTECTSRYEISKISLQKVLFLNPILIFAMLGVGPQGAIVPQASEFVALVWCHIVLSI